MIKSLSAANFGTNLHVYIMILQEYWHIGKESCICSGKMEGD